MSLFVKNDPQNPVAGLSAHQSNQTAVEAVELAAEAALGNLRNSRAAMLPKGPDSTSNCREKTSSPVDAKTVAQSSRFDLQRTSATLLPDMRVAHCIWTATGAFVDLLRRGQDARFGGVQTCGSWSSCPVCSARIAEVRRQELRLLEEWAGSPRHGVRMVLMTLTARHRRRSLCVMMERLTRARNLMQGRKAYQRLRKHHLIGTVTVREVTHGDRNGWHPHYHILLLVRADSDEDALALVEPFRSVWLSCLRKAGLTGIADRAFDIRSGDAVSAYLSKHGRDESDKASAAIARAGWGMAEEMTQSRAKRGRGTPDAPSRSPMQILRDAAGGDDAAGLLWQEYCRVMFRKPQMIWSDGLKALIGLGDVDDEEAAEGEEYTDDVDENLHRFDLPEWKLWRRWRGLILSAARRGPEAVVELLRDGPPASVDDQVVEDDEADEEPSVYISAEEMAAMP